MVFPTGEGATDIEWVEVKDAVKSLTIRKTVLTIKNSPTPNVSSVKAEKL